MGDFNARTAQEHDYITDYSILHFPTLEGSSYPVDTFNQQPVSADYITNKFGLYLLNVCKLHSIHILNGRAENTDDKGVFTYISEQGCSVIDYCIVSSELFNEVLNFEVMLRPESKHMPIICTLQCNLYDTYSTNTDDINIRGDVQLRYKWNPQMTCEFMTQAYSRYKQIQALKANLEEINFRTTDEVTDYNTLINLVNNILYEAGNSMKVKA